MSWRSSSALPFAPAAASSEAWWAARLTRIIAAITLAGSELLLLEAEASGYLDIGLVYRFSGTKLL
jgi:hypothetical protein